MTEKSIWQRYGEERDKLTVLPDADADFIALKKAIEGSEGND